MIRVFAVLVVIELLWVGFPSTAGANYDLFENETLNDKNAFGMEVPYEAGAVREFTASFDTSAFGLDSGENASGSDNLNGCLETPVVFAGRTGWVRFNPDAAGQVYVVAQTPGYDSILWVREARQATWKTTTFSDVRGRPNNCSDVNNAAGNEETVIAGKAENVYYVQVGGKCSGDETTCTAAGVPGGPTTIRLTFTPADSDSDGVPNTKDRCAGGTKGLVTTDGCPDTDRDGIADSTEGPGCVGQKGVRAAPPYNGCFDGPTPPRPGGASVIVRSLGGNPDNTGSVDVSLQLNWPQGAREAFANNSAGDAEVKIPLQERVRWKLRPASKSETREVEVTFRGPNISAKDSDTITLDPKPPKVGRTLRLRSGEGRWYVGLRAQDDRDGSGVSSFVVLDRRRKQIKRVSVCRKSSCRRVATTQVRGLKKKPHYVRVTDAAGNDSKRQSLVASANRSVCKGKEIKVPTGGVGVECYVIGQRCKRRNPPNWGDADPALTCKKRRVRRKR